MSGEDPGENSFLPTSISSRLQKNTIFSAESVLLLFRLARSHYNAANGGKVMTIRTSLIALLMILAVSSFTGAQTVKGPGDAKINIYRKCNWHTNPTCSTYIDVINISNKFGVTKIVLDIAGFGPIDTWIGPSEYASFIIPLSPDA